MRRTRLTTYCAVALLASQSALADLQSPEMGGWQIEVIGGTVSPHNPQVTVRISAYFPNNYWAFGWSWFDVATNDNESHFQSIVFPDPLGSRPNCAYLTPGVPENGAVVGNVVGQVNIGCSALPMNPIPVWEATWSTTNFDQRSVSVETLNSVQFRVYANSSATLDTIDLVELGLFQHGSAVIHVVPAPGASLCAIGGFVLVSRRRR
ncbi:MAG: hypothetical protein H6815_11380 [Phycisphaeraceae bacterium]|nr:hypothetical protein [Phycisphaerales bacterium]MCB9861039.1 hypothetical protein [Phycisphaeraceae bacterium]